MRINRNGRRIALATPFVVALSTVAAHAQAPGRPSQSGAAQAPAAAPPATPADPTASPAEAPPTEAERLIDDAIKKVAAVKTVSAALTQDVKMLGQKFQVKGRYLKGTGSRIYLDLDVVGLPGAQGRMLQVCDGAVLWNYQKLLDVQSYRKISLNPVLQRLQSPELDRAGREQILYSLGVAGPEALLTNIRKTVRFDHKEEGEFNGRPVWVVQGGWRDRGGVPAPAPGRPGPQVGRLPPYIPSHATLTLDQATGWPHKLELHGNPDIGNFDTRAVGLDGQRIGSKSSIEKQQPSEFVLVYTDVKFDPTLTDADFPLPSPPEAEIKDETDEVLARVNALIDQEVQRKRLEAAKATGSVLSRPIEIPSPLPAAEIP
ncbi:LolA family protein [Paludisphaera rhizosphaerae]|uniref:LolA family protein n=1 Tax=Paludisphaera rhizosphaerae TaxID=2711216 RepID=UPI0013E9F74E|nr:hypothetical protein [Paludisphaera rhizosphaerae]